MVRSNATAEFEGDVVGGLWLHKSWGMVTTNLPRHGQKSPHVLCMGREAGTAFLEGHFKHRKQFHFGDPPREILA